MRLTSQMPSSNDAELSVCRHGEDLDPVHTGALTTSEQREFDRLLVKIADASKTWV
jgi:hypothetical protein